MTEPIKVFVGTDVNGGCAECQMVLEYSLKKHASVPVEIIWMKINKDPNNFWGGWNTELWSTPFSGFRWAIPEYCNFKGKAIYQDDDQIWLDDVANLFNNPFEDGKICQAKWHTPLQEIRYCVTLWDCERAKDYMLPLYRNKQFANFHQRMTSKISGSGKVQFFDPRWNCFDGENYQLDEIKILHLTDMTTNPGVKLAVERLGNQSSHWFDGQLVHHRRHDVVNLFQQYYQEALDAGYRVENYIPQEQTDYIKQSQRDYRSNNGFDVRLGQ